MNIYIGCDPGANGGIAVVTKKNAYAFKMPQTSRDLFDSINEIAITAKNENVSVVAYLESISSSPQMGVVSSFTFGRGYGNLEMAFTAAGIPFERVRPQVWQKTMQCMTKGNKNITKCKAQELFPDIKVTHAIADALLIATYGMKQ